MKFSSLALALLVFSATVASIQAWTYTYSLNNGPFPGPLLADIQFQGLPSGQINDYFYLAFIVGEVVDGDDLTFPASVPNGNYFYDGYEHWPDYWTGSGRTVKFIRLVSYGGWDEVSLKNWMMQVGFKTTSSQTHQRKIWFEFQTLGYWYWLQDIQYFSLVAAATCGNGIIETGEQCDGGICCNNCQFAAVGTVCRSAVGECDEVEVCSGAASSCPTDVFSPSTKSCGEKIGFCDTRINNKCPGGSPYCGGVPYVRFGSETFFYDATWENYNVVSFNSFVSAAGEVEGRLAVRNNVNLGGFSIGKSIDTTASGHDRYVPYGLIVGGNATWSSGSLWPDASVSHPSRTEFIAVQNYFNAPADLLNRQLIIAGINEADPNGVVVANPNIAAEFDKAKTYYTRLQGMLSSSATNTQVELKYGGLFVKCNSAADTIYYLDIQQADISSSTWWNLENCNFQSFYVLNIRGSGAVSVGGADFPTITERVIFNVVGSGRTFNTVSGLNGNILAPNNIVRQTNGVTKGLIIAGDMPVALHSRNPNCIKFDPITITGRTAGSIQVKPSRATASLVPVYSVGLFNIGDQITIGSETVTITGAQEVNGVANLVVEPALTQSYPRDTSFATVVPDPINASRTPIDVVKATQPGTANTNPVDTAIDADSSAASTLSVAVASLIFSAILLF